MFKALLKTLPSLSGNMKLSCFVDDYKRHNNKTYTCNIRVAKLLPIAHTLFDKNIYVNLKNNSFEYDVKTFYKSYFDNFYKSNYNYSQLNIPIIDFSDNLPDGNEDFLFGCKRISFSKYENQLAFFAPIYIESLDDIKDKYFKITCIFNKINTLKKELIIDIYNNEVGENYLADYLKRYASKIDDKVIYMSSTYKNMYYGIDLLHGGFIHIEDNISKNLYKQYYTINDFDAIINFGFKRNNMMMKQIIPLSFYFNPQSLLSQYEYENYKDAKITIYGEWYTGKLDETTIEEKFYNFSDNYTFYNESIYQLTTSNIFAYVNNSENILNMNYPAFKEASSENYKFINTIVKNYNRWKLKYSSDDYPYIVNNNFAFSNNQNSLYSYKEFPLIYKTKDAICKFKGENYNMLFDLDDIYNDNGNLLNIKSEYYDYFNKNYVTNFYNLLVKHQDNTYDNIFTNNEYWVTVNTDNKLYYKGVLYDFNILYSQYKDMPKIDKFSVFVNPEMMSSISNFDYNTTYNSVKYTINTNNSLNELNNQYKEITKNSEIQLNFVDYISSYIYKYDFINSNSAYITNNTIVYNDQCCALKDKSGDYVDINAYWLNYQEANKLHYTDQNLYVDIKEVLMYANLFVQTVLDADNNEIIINGDLYDKIYNNYNLDIITGYRIIDIKYKNNIISEIYSKLLKIYPDKNYRFNNDNLIYSEHKFLENDDIYWAYDYLYFSIYPNKIKYKLLENSNLLYDLPYDTKITIYFETDFIKLNDLKDLYDYQNDPNFVKLNKYYISNTLYDKDDKQSYSDICFIKLKEKDNHYGKYTTYDFDDVNNYNNINDKNKILKNFHENVLFIDTYNLDRFYCDYFKEDDNFHFYKVENCYCNFLNLEHIQKYFSNLYNNEDLTEFKRGEDNQLLSNSEKIRKIQDTIYIKLHLLNNVVIDYDNKSGINFINTTTVYIKLNDYFRIGNNNSNITLYQLLNYIGYNENGYFYFTNNYFNDYKKELNNLPYQIHNFELCFKKTMGIVNEKLYKLIMQLNSHNLFKDLYLYRLYNYDDYKFEYVLNNTKIDEDDNDKDQKWENSKIYDSEYIELYPYFNSIYTEEKIQTKIYTDTFLNNIIKSENSDTYKHAVYNIDTLVYCPKDDEYPNTGLCAYRYSLYTKYNNGIINSNTFVNKYIHYPMSYILQTIDNNSQKVINEEEISINSEIPVNTNDYTYNYFLNPNCSYSLAYNTWYKDYGKMITYNCNDTTYGFYIIHEEFDNTRNTLNLLSENFNKINVASYINGIDSNKFLDDQYTYLNNYYHNLVPYINNSNIVKDFLNNVNIVIKPNKYTLTNIYQQTPNTDENNNTTYSYNIILKGKTSLQLLRYFDNILPYIYETNNITSYHLYYKNTNKFIENDLYNKKISYIMYQYSHGIYDDKQISYFDNYDYLNENLGNSYLKISKFTPVEYKNYNNNKFYNLETSFSIKPQSDNEDNKNLFTKKEIDTLENDQNYIYELFKQHLLKENNMLTDNDILFLYKKYDVKFSHNIKSFHKNSLGKRDYDLYTLIIKYNLF